MKNKVEKIIFAMVFLLLLGGNIMIDLLLPTDSLAVGAEKINNAISAFNQTQTGDSSLEAAAARVSDDGSVYVNLKDRLDTEHKAVKSELGNKAARDEIALKADKVEVQALASGSPKATFTTLALLQADTAANTADGKKSIYLVTANGNWYYWNGTAWTSGGMYQSTGIADKSVVFRNMSDEILGGFNYEALMVGEDISSVTGATGGAFTGSIYINANSKTVKNGYIADISLFAKSTGIINFYIGTIADNVFTPRTNFSVTISNTGLVKLKAGVDFVKIPIYNNEYLAIYSKTGNVLGFSPIAGDYYYQSIAEPFTTVALLNTTTNKLFYCYNVDCITNTDGIYNQLRADVESIKSKIPQYRKGTVLDEISDFTSLPEKWQCDAGWTLGKQASCSTANTKLYTDNVYGIDNRIIRWEFKLTSNGEIDFATIPATQRLPYAGSVIRVSSIDNTVKFMSKYTDGASLSVLKSVSAGFSLLNQQCVIEIEKDGRATNVRLWQVNGKGRIETSRTNVNLRDYEQGCLQGSPSVILRSGAVNLYSHKHVALGKKDCLLYVLGDSITEGRGVSDEDKYGGLLQNYYGKDEVLVSGIGGSCYDEAYIRVLSETKNINPKNILINLGTNTAAFEYLQTIIDYFESKGSNIFICTLPAVDTYTANILTMPYNIVRLDIEMKDDNGNLISDYYPPDDLLHPNELGNMVMFYRILQDMNTKLYE